MRWIASIGNKFFRVVPGETLLIICSTLVSQVSLLLAFLLPLKIVILLGSTGMPRYFPDAFSLVDRDFLVVILSFSTVFFYVLYLLSEKLVDIYARRGALALLKRSHKIALFENDEDVASRNYQRYSRSLATIVFISLIVLALSYLYFEISLFLFLYSILAFVLIILLNSHNEKIHNSLAESPGRVIGVFASVGFLLSFFFMVGHFLLGQPPSLLAAIISVILIRQGCSRVASLVNDIKALSAQKYKLNALFFHGHILVKEARKHEVSFWSLLKSPKCESWLREVLQETLSEKIHKLKSSWVQLGGQDIIALHIKSYNVENRKIADHLLKLFNSNKSSLARHEATLLSECSELPSMPLIRVVEVEGFHCHIYHWVPSEKILKEKVKLARLKILSSLILIDPGIALISQYKRSHPVLWHRLDENMMDRICTVAEKGKSEDLEKIKLLSRRRQDVVQRLKKLPLVIINPDQGPDDFLEARGGKVITINWSRWSLEPVGAGWSTQPSQAKRLRVSFTKAKSERRGLEKVRFEDVYLAALVYSFEKSYVRHDFLSAIKLVPRILKYLEGESDVSEASSRECEEGKNENYIHGGME
ncbi:hypothetical protein [Halomonas sp. E14]|uniref:hypothetical protein n=1 Tax=Halomonas sp. E14 TaxID=3397245 RepID=UPI00403E4CC8